MSCRILKTSPVFFLLVLYFTAIPVQAQLFMPFTSMQVIRTNYFDIIFPEESERSARLLASYADQVYEEMSALLGIELPRKLPVTFTPHTERFNGFYSSMPSSHIVLFDTPMDVEWTVFADNLRGLFIHELAHAISLNSRTPFFSVLHRIFGNWVSPVFLNAPLFMVEGVTISFESFDGYGRANDPRTRQYLRQALYEGRFLSPFQASGVFDVPLRESYYDYGGLFSFWLIENYGMEKYAGLWQVMGGISRFSLFVYRSDFYRLFKNVYEIDFLDAWDAFKDFLALDSLEENENEVLPVKYIYFSERNSFLQGLSANGIHLYYINMNERSINSYNTQTGEVSSFNAGYSYDLDVSPDGSTLLLSGYDYAGEMAFATVSEYRWDSGRRTGRGFNDLYSARYFRDGVIGLGSELHNNSIVFSDFRGHRETLLQGHEGLMFSGPQAVDDEWIAFIAAHNGVRELWLLNYLSRELFRVETDTAGNYQHYLRDLGVSGGRLFFSHNSDDRMYKLGMIDLDTMQAVFSERDFSGGVFNAVSINGEIYYVGSFFRRDRLLKFPEMTSSLSGFQTGISLVKIDAGDYQIDTEHFFNGPSERYNALRYMNPFQFWLPLPLIRTTRDNFFDFFDGAGIISLISDPTGRNFITIEAYADIEYRMAMINQLSWQNTLLGFPLTLDFFDRVVEGNIVYRNTGAGISGNFIWSTGKWQYGFSLGGTYMQNALQGTERSAYNWEKTRNLFYVSTGFSLSGSQFGFQFSGMSSVNDFLPRLDGAIMARVNTRFPLRLTIFGAYDDRGMNLHGVSGIYGNNLMGQFALTEYTAPSSISLNWITGAEATLGLFSFEIQRNFSHAYFNRFNGSLSLRNQLYDSDNHPAAEGLRVNNLHLVQSLMLKLGMEITFLPIVKHPLKIVPYFHTAWKFSNSITGDGSPFYMGMGVDIQL